MTIDEFLRQELADPESGFSIGVNGAIAEFFRDATEAGAKAGQSAYSISTPRGGMRIRLHGDVRPVAIETPSRHPDYWQQRVAFCLDAGKAVMANRKSVTALGADAEAIRAADRSALRFDLGLGIPHLDACVRTDDEDLIAQLLACCGRDLLKDGAGVVAAIIEKGPHRVFASRLGRIEVYTPIPVDKTVPGPHTHLLPELLGKPAAGAAWIAAGARSCLDVYPANPARRESGAARTFDAARHARFQRALSAWGPPAYVAEKQRTEEWLRQGLPPQACPPAEDPLARAGRRVAVRQIARAQPDSALLCAWRRALEDPGSGDAARTPDPH